MAFKLPGYTPFTKLTDPVKKPTGPVTPSTQAEYMEREVWNKVQEQERKKKKKKKPADDDSVKMTEEQMIKHREKVREYNRKKAKPLNETQKKKISEKLRGMDPNDPEAKLLQDMLNQPKNR